MTSPNSTVVGIHYADNTAIEITITDSVISGIKKLHTYNRSLPYVAPGLIDLQVNGFDQFDFNALSLSYNDIDSLSKSLLNKGITSFFPTIITNSSLNTEKLLSIINNAKHYSKLFHSCLAGIHIEGPFISSCDGPRGAHNKDFIQAPNWDLMQKWQYKSGNLVELITLSPEWPNSYDFIRRCVQNGIVVSIGHTAATRQQIDWAVEAGATMSTHLGNGAHLMLPRHPNYIWEQMAQDKLTASLIADGVHLPGSVIKSILRAKKNNAVIVSDSVCSPGKKPGLYKTAVGKKILVDDDGMLRLADDPRILAGSPKPIIDGIENLYSNNICSLAEAWDFASRKPAEMMNIGSIGSIEVGKKADLVLFSVNDDRRIDINNVLKNGTYVSRS